MADESTRVKFRMSPPRTDSRTLAGAAVFTAFVAAATSVFSVYIPATTGYFNVGEIMVYISALLMGPYVGAFAAGFGSMLSDLSLGYPYFAPGTLVIKGLEGFIVGFLATRAFARVTKVGWRGLSITAGLLFAIALAYVGTTYFSGYSTLTLGGAWYLPTYEVYFEVPPIFWVALAALAFGAISFVGLRTDSRSGLSVIAVLAGGSEMVLGYYLYESFVIGLIAPQAVVAQIAPAAEVPFNIAQALIGLLVAVPVVRSIKRVLVGRRLPLSANPEPAA